jgi:hypothetical protein
LKYSGESWKSKVNRTIEKIKEYGADVYVVTALDDVACNF